MNKKYVICIEEVVSKEFEVFAENEENAMEIARKKYRSGEFVLEPGMLSAKKMAIVFPDGAVTDWIEF